MSKLLLLGLLSLALIWTPVVISQEDPEETGQEIKDVIDATALVTTAENLLDGKISVEEFVDFDVHRPSGVVEREMNLYLKGKDFSFTLWTKPTTERGNTLLKRQYDLWEHDYKTKKELRIPFSMMHNSVMGSDFTYDDLLKLAKWSLDYDHKLVGKSKKMEDVYIIDMTPKAGRPITYPKLQAYVRKDGVPVRVHFYTKDENNKVKITRVLLFSAVKKVSEHNRPTKWTMIDLTQKGHFTVFQIKDARYDQLTDESVFDKRSLTNPPEPAFK